MVILAVFWAQKVYLFMRQSVDVIYGGQRTYYISSEVFWLSVSSLLAATALAGVLYISYREMSRAQFLLFVLTAFLLQLVWRIFMRAYWPLTSGKSTSRQRVLILGAGMVGKQIAKTFRSQSKSKVPIINYLDDDPGKHSHSGVLGPLSALESVLDSQQVDDVIFTLPLEAHKNVTDAVISLRVR